MWIWIGIQCLIILRFSQHTFNELPYHDLGRIQDCFIEQVTYQSRHAISFSEKLLMQDLRNYNVSWGTKLMLNNKRERVIILNLQPRRVSCCGCKSFSVWSSYLKNRIAVHMLFTHFSAYATELQECWQYHATDCFNPKVSLTTASHIGDLGHIIMTQTCLQ